MIRRVALVLIAIAAALVASTAVQAGRPQVCKPFTQSGIKISYETIGTAWTCSSAKTWIVKLAADKVGGAEANIPLKNGPHGYHCFAFPRKQPLALDGTCFTGTLAYPGTGFAWLT